MAEADTGTPETTAGGNGAAAAISIEDLQAQLAAADARAKQSHDQYLRSLAEMENVRKRAHRDVEAANRFGLERFAQEIRNLDRQTAQNQAFRVNEPPLFFYLGRFC